jgi:uncharacterized protein YdaT
MPSEYDIYRAYAGMNRSKSGFDAFMEGLKEIQAGARADRQLDLQERSQNRADQTMKLNMEQRALTNKRYEENKKEEELKNLIGAARTDYQKAQIYRSVGGGKYDDIAADLEQNYNKQEDNKGLYRDSFYGTEEEQSRKLSDFLDVADPTSAMYDKAIIRRNKLLSDIADTSDEILKDPEFGPSYQRFSDTITSPLEKSDEELEIARKGLIQTEKEYRAKQQKFFKDKTKKTSSIPNVNIDTGYDPVIDYLMEGTETGNLFAGLGTDDEKPSPEEPLNISEMITAGGVR